MTIQTDYDEFDSKFVVFGEPSGNIRYLMHQPRIREILMSLEQEKIKPILKVRASICVGVVRSKNIR